jgi:hypothetical protein
MIQNTNAMLTEALHNRREQKRTEENRREQKRREQPPKSFRPTKSCYSTYKLEASNPKYTGWTTRHTLP